MSDVILGKIIETEQERDAIHVAVAPVIAGERLYPGQPIGLMDGGGRATSNGPHVGIVDPFLTAPVFDGQRFWMCLFQNTVTGMRHHWAHPAFGGPQPSETASASPIGVDEAASVKWIAAFAEKLDETYDGLMLAAQQYVDYGSFTRDDSETYKEFWDEFPEFWKHWAVVTGRDAPEEGGAFFTCSC